jgi:hypothetical protein
VTWFQHATASFTTGQLICIPLAAAGLLALAVAYLTDRHRDRRSRCQWEQALADSAHRAPVAHLAPAGAHPVDWSEEGWA